MIQLVLREYECLYLCEISTKLYLVIKIKFIYVDMKYKITKKYFIFHLISIILNFLCKINLNTIKSQLPNKKEQHI